MWSNTVLKIKKRNFINKPFRRLVSTSEMGQLLNYDFLRQSFQLVTLSVRHPERASTARKRTGRVLRQAEQNVCHNRLTLNHVPTQNFEPSTPPIRPWEQGQQRCSAGNSSLPSMKVMNEGENGRGTSPHHLEGVNLNRRHCLFVPWFFSIVDFVIFALCFPGAPESQTGTGGKKQQLCSCRCFAFHACRGANHKFVAMDSSVRNFQIYSIGNYAFF